MALVGLILALLVAGSCSSCSRTILALSNTTDTVEIFVQPAFGTDLRTKIAILPFQAPKNAVEAGNVLTETYYQEVLRAGVSVRSRWFGSATLVTAPAGLADGQGL